MLNLIVFSMWRQYRNYSSSIPSLSLYIFVCVCACMPQHIDVSLLLFLLGQILVSLVKAPLQFYYLNTGTGNQRAN